MALLDQLRQRLAWSIFTVDQDHLRLARRDGIKPFYQVGLPCVGAEAAERVHLRAHRDCFAKDLDVLCPVDQPASRTPQGNAAPATSLPGGPRR